MLAHLIIRNGKLTWSGYRACGDPCHTHALVVDVGRDFIITEDEKLYLTGLGPMQFGEFTPSGLVLAARHGMSAFQW